MEPREETGVIEFPVDLNKKEYIEYFRVVDRVSGVNKRRLFFTAVVGGWLLIELLQVVRQPASAFTDVLPFAGMLVVFLLLYLVAFPLFRRWQSGRSFDAAVNAGQVFFGTFTLTEEKAVKVTASVKAEIPLSRDTLFVETKQMQCFLARGSRAIILPARCLTREDAEAVRTLVTATLPPENCRLLRPVEVQRETRMELPAETDAPPLLSISVSYRQDELKRLMKTMFSRTFFPSFLLYMPLSFIAALLFGITRGFVAGAIVFWGMIGAVALLLWFALRRKYPANVENMPPFSFELLFTEDHLVVESGNGKMFLRWEQVSHAVEGEDAVEFYNRHQYVYVPKRCIEDMEECRRMVDHCRQGRKGTKK